MLREYSGKMVTLLIFSAPRLGDFQYNISLFRTGFRVLKKWRSPLALGSSPSRTTRTRGDVPLFAERDLNAPFKSARVEMLNTWDTSVDSFYPTMVRSLWEPRSPESVFRFDVNFKIPEKILGAFIIGRLRTPVSGVSAHP